MLNKKVLKRRIKFIKEPIKKFASNGRIRRASQYAEYYKKLAIEKNTILYESRDGNSMTDSPYAMFSYMLENPSFKDYVHIWSIEDFDVLSSVISRYKEYPNVKFVKRNSSEYLKCLASCEYLINNSTFQSFYTSKPGQTYINTWHGTPLKSMGFDIPGNPSHSQNVVRNFLSTSYLLSPNAHTTKMFTHSYKLEGLYEGTIIEEGYPRIDLTLNTNPQQYRNYLRDLTLIIDDEKETILYAPTWKGNNVSKAHNDTKQIIADIEFLRSQLGHQFNILTKVHPYLYKVACQCPELKGYLIPDFIDPNELLAAVDILITDYSSIFFDYLVTDKPILFYTWDADVYSEERGQYISNESLPGPIVYTSDELVEAIRNIDQVREAYKDNYQQMKREFTCYEDGRVTERIVQYIFTQSSGELNTHKNLTGKKEKILIYPGGMKNNGITSSFINLMNNIDFDRYDVTCFTNTQKEQEVLNNINKINKKVRFLFKPGHPIYTLQETYQNNFIHNRGERGYLGKKLYPEEAYKREQRRLFGQTHFDYAIDFSGYSFFWAKYLLATDAKKKICYMHNDLLSDSERKVGNKRPHRTNLRGLFSVYHRFDKLVSVSKGTMELNRANLIEYADYEKFDYIMNSINPEKILQKDDIGSELSVDTLENWRSYGFISRAKIVSVEGQEICNSLPGSLNFRKSPLNHDLLDKEVLISREAAKDGLTLYKCSLNNRVIGWVSDTAVELLPDSIVEEQTVDKIARIVKPKRNHIWAQPYKTPGSYRISTSGPYKNKIITIDKEVRTQRSRYCRISLNGTQLGWIDLSALKVNHSLTIDDQMDGKTIAKIKKKRKMLLSKQYMKQKEFLDQLENRTLKEKDISGCHYRRISMPGELEIFNKAYPNYGVQKVADAKEYEGKLVSIIRVSRTKAGIYYLFKDGDETIGWLNVQAFGKYDKPILIKDTEVYKRAEIHINEKTTLVKDIYTLASMDRAADLDGIVVDIDREAVTSEGSYSRILQNNVPLGWIDNDSLIIREVYGLVVGNKYISYPKEENINFVNMGRLSPEKAQDNLITAFAKLNETYPNSKLYILGQGPLEKDLRNLIIELDLTESVFLLGQLENPFGFLSKCDCFVLSSHYEGQPMVLLEAMTLDMNIVATDIVANRTVLEDGKYGVLVENSIEGLVSGMESIAVNKCKKVGAKFDYEQYNNLAMESFYNCLAGKQELTLQMA